MENILDFESIDLSELSEALSEYDIATSAQACKCGCGGDTCSTCGGGGLLAPPIIT